MRLFLWGLCLVCTTPLLAEKGILVLHVQDLKGHPIAGVRFRAGAGSALATTDSFGAIRLKLASNSRPGDVVMLELIAVPKNRDLVIISPWDKWAHVPPFEEEPKNFVPVVLVQRGDRACLESPPCLRAATEQINRTNTPTRTQDLNQDERAKEALATVAKTFGLSPEDVNAAIHAWGERTEDPYDKGVVALYQKNFPQASQDLQISIEKRMSAEAKAQSDVADAAEFLGRSLYEQGKYRKAAEALQQAAARRPYDSQIQNNLGLSLALAGDYVRAEAAYRRALTLDKETGTHESLAPTLHNFARLLLDKGKSEQAEALYRQALAINERAFGPDDPRVALTLSDLGTLLQERGDYSGAEALYKRALRIHRSRLGPLNAYVGMDLANLALLFKIQGYFAKAEPLYRQALAIQEKALGPDHPKIATDLNNLASLLQDQGDLVEAEPLYRRALAIEEKKFGPNHPDIAAVSNNLALLLCAKGDYTDAEQFALRALDILEKKFGPKNSRTEQARANLELVLNQKFHRANGK